MKNILITGAAGEIGTVPRAGLYGSGRSLVYSISSRRPPREFGEQCITADLTDPMAAQTAVKDIESVIHLAGVPREGPWNTILPNNVIATYNVFDDAAHRH